jgi:hypothetical protein
MCWVLLRAFGPLSAAFESPLIHARAMELAQLFNLGGRLAARLGKARLALELGESCGATLWRAFQVGVGRVLHRRELADTVAKAADEARCGVVFLKSMALHLTGITAAGARDLADVDVLAETARRAALEDALRSAGFRTMDLRSRGESAVGFFEPSRGTIDLHPTVPGLRLAPGSSFAEFADLRQTGLLAPAPGMGGSAWVAAPPVLAAQALAHGIGHHGFDPAHYPLLRMVADLVDLGFGGEAGAATGEQIRPWLEAELSEAEVQAARELCVALSAGDPELFSGASHDRPAVKLLRHILAGSVDPRYQRVLRVHALVPGLRSDRSLAFILRAGWRHTFRPREDMELLWGPARGPMGHLHKRFVEPLQAVADAARHRLHHGWQALRGRRHDGDVEV